MALPLGTLVAVIAYCWNDVVRYTRAWLRSVRHRRVEAADERLAWYIAAATVPAALAGAAGESVIEDKLGQPWQIAIFLAGFGSVSYSERSRRHQKLALPSVRASVGTYRVRLAARPRSDRCGARPV